LARPAVAARILDRGNAALGEGLGLLDLLRARFRVVPPEEGERSDGPELTAHEWDEHSASYEVGVGSLPGASVAVRDGDRAREGAGRAGCRRAGGLVRGHAACDDRRRAVGPLDDHHCRGETGDLHRRVEDAVHQLLEIDRAPELTEQAIPATLALCAVESVGELDGELVHLDAHLAPRLHESRALVGAGGGVTTAGDDDDAGNEGERQRTRYDYGCSHPPSSPPPSLARRSPIEGRPPIGVPRRTVLRKLDAATRP